MIMILIAFFIPSLLVLVRFFLFVVEGRERLPTWLNFLLDVPLLFIFPVFLLGGSMDTPLDCCNLEGPVFAEEHTTTLIAWWLIGLVAYGFVQYRKETRPPVIEVAIAWVLLFSIVINGLIIYHIGDYSWFFSVPIILLLIIALVRQHYQLLPRLKELTRTMNTDMLDEATVLSANAERSEGPATPIITGWQRHLAAVLNWPVLVKYPVLTVLGLPVFVLVDSLLLLFGQRPDSFILAFTQTYHYQLSELTYLCADAQCGGGHYLCSVAAGGHKNIVKPVRLGVRHGRRIVCNRQLLVANAFEEVLQERFPATHRIIRRYYDRVGAFIHKDYTPYENKFLCDFIYLLMKPADWAFRLFLYAVDRNPENRIARQYTHKKIG